MQVIRSFFKYTLQAVVVLLLVLVRSEDGAHSDANTWNDHMEADTRAWCSSVQSTPEPSLVFYNRIPKCASSTMQALFQAISHHRHPIMFNSSHLKDIDAFRLGQPMWSIRPPPAVQQDIYEHINAHLTSPNNTSMLVFDGHISYFPFNTSWLRPTTPLETPLEYTNVIRECETRQQSFFFFSLYQSKAATEARKNKKIFSFQRHLLQLNDSVDVTTCLTSETCLRQYIKPSLKAYVNSRYMGDCSRKGGCSEQESLLQKQRTDNSELFVQREVSSVLNNVKANSGVYKTFGLTEYLTQYLEMLECVYPSMRGIVQVHNSTLSSPANVHSDVFRHPETTRITNKLFAEQCHDSPDSRLYTLMNTTFWSRYHALKSQPGRCCRSGVIL